MLSPKASDKIDSLNRYFRTIWENFCIYCFVSMYLHTTTGKWGCKQGLTPHPHPLHKYTPYSVLKWGSL